MAFIYRIKLNSLDFSRKKKKAEEYRFILVHSLYSYLASGDSWTVYELHHACIRLHINLPCFVPGRAEPRKAQLGTPERRPARPNHSRRCSEPCWDQTQTSRGGGEQVAGACSKFLSHHFLLQLVTFILVAQQNYFYHWNECIGVKEKECHKTKVFGRKVKWIFFWACRL